MSDTTGDNEELFQVLKQRLETVSPGSLHEKILNGGSARGYWGEIVPFKGTSTFMEGQHG
jgi:hypothetical protein